ncbi:ISL3 family transposase [Virgibacillus sp. MSP4-1]|uniref:ISL3 family transposase n=1 Tax=Virgibacillus sp. MSP4-1 TaxID=2700081 RepID=UPI00137C103E|nr:ISL3 family transposase [Virgibacillus sp. MSP4-1]QHS22913.1 ISL3 family transposase [Virgibacillus sp. MSP4-1]QHS23759.1 ISL3 family transposase [Virgibacillus sp. MSP4-1]QHS24126.1 ISL3 family transposase [Virgibacillus sp. MSP4-1]QHS24299.1 ISL3 family transposase [Virgibacillus sp. MSP4-1]
MQKHFIIEMLGIKDKHVDVWDMTSEPDKFYVELYTKVKTQKCPFCKEKTKRVHSYRNQQIQGPIVSNKPVKISLRKRRYLCVNCRHTFYEKLQMVDRYQRCTSSIQTTALTYTAVGSFTTAAQLTGMSSNRLLRIFDRRDMKTKKVLPRAIAIDEFKGDAGGERFQTVIADIEHKEIIDVLPDRKVDTIKRYLKSCDTSNVEIVVMDLSRSFKQAVQKALGDPLIIADRFHFMRQVYWALDSVRREVQHDLEKNERIRMKRSKKLLWKSQYKLTDEQKEKVNQLLQIHPRLKEAYELKNKLDQWFKESDKITATQGFEECLSAMKASNIEAFHKVMKTFKRWRQEILQSFMYPFNNGYIEGVNNTIKVAKRMSYGIKDFKRLKKKILWRQEVRRALA